VTLPSLKLASPSSSVSTGVSTPHTSPSRVRGPRRGLNVPESLVVIEAPPQAHEELRVYVGRLTQLAFAQGPLHGASLLMTLPSAAVLLTVPRDTREAMLDSYAQFRRDFPYTPFIAFFLDGWSDLAALARVAAADVRHVLLSDRLHTYEHCCSALATSNVWSTGARIWRSTDIVADDTVETLMLAALRLAWQPITLPQLALAARMHERTLRKYCYRHSLPSPQWFIGWARCLVASYYLEEPGRSIQSIATLLNFNSAVSLANHIKRYTTYSASELRRLGPLKTAARKCQEFLEAARNAAPPAVQ
jgi:AraC-like DNA-binding protein